MSLHQASQQLIFQLMHLYDEREAKNIADLVMEHVTEWKRIDRILGRELPLSHEKTRLLEKYTAELMEHKPVQYVLHEAWFGGLKLFVDESVLIPRPETEELVEWAVEEARAGKYSNGRIIDIGTGSGCIAISVKKKLPNAVVSGCDISAKALTVARKNAESSALDVSLIECDFLKETERQNLPPADILVSNPPYVPVRDKHEMAKHVLYHEPGIALFVTDNNPLIFYEAIALFAIDQLSPDGVLFVEIHEEFGQQVSDLFKAFGFNNVTLKKDLQQRDRMVRAARE